MKGQNASFLKMSKKERYFTPRRIFALISFIIVIALAFLTTYFLWDKISSVAASPEALRDLILSYGFLSYAVGLGLQVLQVFVALLPGELIELALGYSFGFFGGTLICLCGIATATVPVFLLTKKFGMRFVEIFFDREKIENISFLNNQKKLKSLVFLLFFIPGTPKDLLTYFVGLTPLTLTEFLTLTLVARIPSIVTSTASGSFFAEGDYFLSAIVFLITGALSIFGLWIYRRLMNKLKSKKNN